MIYAFYVSSSVEYIAPSTLHELSVCDTIVTLYIKVPNTYMNLILPSAMLLRTSCTPDIFRTSYG